MRGPFSSSRRIAFREVRTFSHFGERYRLELRDGTALLFGPFGPFDRWRHPNVPLEFERALRMRLPEPVSADTLDGPAMTREPPVRIAALLLAPSEDSPQAEIRALGARAFVVGLMTLATFAAVMAALPPQVRTVLGSLVMPVGFLGILLVSIGGYRIAFGARASTLSPLQRIGVPVAFTAVSVLLLGLLSIVVARWFNL